MTDYPDKILFVYRDLPLPGHPEVAPGCRGSQLRRGTGRLLEIS